MPLWSFSKPETAIVPRIVKDETAKPGPIQYPPLLPTLQTHYGMVCNDGAPMKRSMYQAKLNKATQDAIEERVSILRLLCADLKAIREPTNATQIRLNLEACSLPVEKHELLEYIRNRKRIDTEQAVAMVVAFLLSTDSDSLTSRDEASDEFEATSESALYELLHDPGVVTMMETACMWREVKHFEVLQDTRTAAVWRKRGKILKILRHLEGHNQDSDSELVDVVQKIRRMRVKCNNSQHLTMPPEMMSGNDELKQQWGPDKSYRLGPQEHILDDEVRVIPKRTFARIHRLLHSLLPPHDITSRYAHDVDKFIKYSGTTSARRMAALESSSDTAAMAYSFIAAQREFQLKVVSDHKWSRFLVKGEGAMILQNRPDVLTSFEDILVRHATDLKALTAVRCPRGLRDHFSTQQDIKDRARAVCELMERYVRDFGGGRMQNLVAQRDIVGGNTRGPVDYYNALCDELRDCSIRAKAAGFDLHIGPVHKFLAADIMYHNRSWKHDAFAGDKIPGWVEYLARVRGEEIALE